MGVLQRFERRHSRVLNITISITLYFVIGFCYALTLILFLSPQALRLESLISADAQGVKPTTVVTLVSALLVGATSALVTRCVEQSLWLKLTPREVKKRLTIGESRRLAQWSVSPMARITYLFDGASFLLRVGGILLLATVVVSPVLVTGISQVQSTLSDLSSLPSQGDPWEGWLDVANEAYNGGNFADVPGIVAALATLNNLSAPASPICTSSSCSVDAVSRAIQADCTTTSAQQYSSLRTSEQSWTYSSTYNPDISVTLSGGSPYSYANFSGGYAPGCEYVGSPCPPGSWSVIFGAFVNATDYPSGPWYVNTVDCLLTFGTVDIVQKGGNTPRIQDSSYRQDSSSLSSGEPDAAIIPLHRIYTEENAYSSQYTFTAATGTGDGADTLYKSPVATLLLGPKANSSADEVAARIEKIFNMATLLAFSRSPRSSNLLITTETQRPVYVYDRRLLTILAVPLLAIFLGVCGRWRVAGDDRVIGYDPVEIARRGPVKGLLPPEESGAEGMKDRKVTDEKKVWCYTETGLDGAGRMAAQEKFAVN